MQQDILPEGTKAQFLSVGNALGYGGQIFSDFKVFAIHLQFDHCCTWIHLFLATPKYLMALAQATGTQPSLTMTSFFVFLPMLPMHCFSELVKHIMICNISGLSWFALIPNRANPRLLSPSAGMVCCWYPTPMVRIPQHKLTRFTALYPPFGTQFPYLYTCILVSSSFL